MTTNTVQRPKTCGGCGKPFTPDEWSKRHFGHDGDCRYYLDEHDWVIPSCSCDLAVHGRCCETCNPPAGSLVSLEPTTTDEM